MANKLIRLTKPVVVAVPPAAAATTTCATCGQAIQPAGTPMATGQYGEGQEFVISEADFAAMVENGEAVDLTPPVISAVADASPTDMGATITWTTDRLADSQVFFRVQGETPWDYTTITNTSPRVLAHTYVVTDCVPSTVYEYYVRSQAEYGDAATSPASSFPTFTTEAGE